MNKIQTSDLEMRLKSEISVLVPDVLDNILSECDKNVEYNKIRIVTPRNTNKYIRWVASVAAVFILAVSVTIGVDYNFGVDSIIGLDVNPSIEIEINRGEKVIGVQTLNHDAEVVLDDMDLKGCDLDVAVNALLGSMMKKGYINNEQNSVLVSISNDNTEKGAQLEQKLAKSIDEAFQSSEVDGAVILQVDKKATVKKDTEIKNLAQNNEISVGKANLVKKITEQDPTLEFEELASLSVTQLSLIAESKQTALEGVVANGSASESAYIGNERACDVALNHAGAKASATNINITLNVKDGVFVYDVNFLNGNKNLTYKVDAITGDIVSVTAAVDNTVTKPPVIDEPEPVPPSVDEPPVVEPPKVDTPQQDESSNGETTQSPQGDGNTTQQPEQVPPQEEIAPPIPQEPEVIEPEDENLYLPDEEFIPDDEDYLDDVYIEEETDEDADSLMVQ